MQETLPFFTMDQARNKGVVAMEMTADRAERAHPGWKELAVAKLLTQVQTFSHAVEFIIEDIRLAIASELPEPPDQRAWGSVTQAAIKRLYIVPTGNYAPAKSSNASPKPLYRRGSAV